MFQTGSPLGFAALCLLKGHASNGKMVTVGFVVRTPSKPRTLFFVGPFSGSVLCGLKLTRKGSGRRIPRGFKSLLERLGLCRLPGGLVAHYLADFVSMMGYFGVEWPMTLGYLAFQVSFLVDLMLSFC